MQTATSMIVVSILFGIDVCRPEYVNTEVSPRVNSPSGEIEGYYKTASDGKKYEAYEGIPYAEPPIGEYRFMIPKIIAPWTSTLMAKGFGPKCMQFNQSVTNMVEGSEDCLFLNIYTARNRCSKSKLLPVIFFIHGGAFRYGSGAENGPKYLLNEDVTYVNINYRLGPLGFLSTEDEIVPGNMGLKDQVIALQWVKENIESFGGDPSKITIFGQSAGGASVHYHYLTKLTKGLFHGGMSLSGTALDPWAQAEAPLETAKKVAELVGCQSKNVKNMIDCLKEAPAEDIVRTVGDFLVWLITPTAPFAPVVEKGSDKFTFIDRSPIEIITSGDAQDVPWITGVVSEEALALTGLFMTNETLTEELNSNWETLAPYVFDYNYTIPEIDHPKVAALIRQHYYGELPIDSSTINQTIEVISDRLIGYTNGEAAQLQACFSNSPVRFYYFSYRGAHSYSEILSGSSENFGVCHIDDIAYAFELLIDTSTTSEDRAMQKRLTGFWTAFATHLTPNVGVEWPVVRGCGHKNLNYMHIAGPNDLYMDGSDNFGDKDFWNSIGFDENRL